MVMAYNAPTDLNLTLPSAIPFDLNPACDLPTTLLPTRADAAPEYVGPTHRCSDGSFVSYPVYCPGSQGGNESMSREHHCEALREAAEVAAIAAGGCGAAILTSGRGGRAGQIACGLLAGAATVARAAVWLNGC